MPRLSLSLSRLSLVSLSSHVSRLKLTIYSKTSTIMLMLTLTILKSKFKVKDHHKLTLKLNLNLNINLIQNLFTYSLTEKLHSTYYRCQPCHVVNWQGKATYKIQCLYSLAQWAFTQNQVQKPKMSSLLGTLIVYWFIVTYKMQQLNYYCQL